MSKIKHYSYFLKKRFKNWDPNFYDWKNDSWMLASRASKHFEIWWDPTKWNWEDDSDFLAKYCCDYIHIWWDPKKFDWHFCTFLFYYCCEYKHIWEEDYKRYKIIKELSK
tara:strand:+ start:1857 stop:2186 length:330 start_codon:yes stop_codon:yes gene_type:complete